MPTTIVEHDRKPLWRALTHQVDTVIKANCTTHVIPSAHFIVVEVLRLQNVNAVEEHGTGVSRERWMDHTTAPDMVRDSGLSYRRTYDGGREVYCPVCLKYSIG